MCGIVAYIGQQQASPIIIKGLKRLEYRGYDSTGISLFDGTELHTVKTKGKVSDLESKLETQNSISAQIGIGHTRWATHGIPNDLNAHPQASNSSNLVLVHNGIIENYASIKEELIQRGYTFSSDTDTEVLVNLIEDVQKKEKVKLGKAVQIALTQVIGAYAIVVFDRRKPNELIAARLGSPLAIGIGKEEFFVASDATPFIEYTKNVIYLEEEHLAIIRCDRDITIRKINNDKVIKPYVEELQMSLENIQKGGYDHFMLKEIFEQPQAIRDTLRGRLLSNEGKITLSSLNEHENKFLKARRILIVACGTSWHAGLVAEYLLEKFTRIPVEVEYASEFRYRDPIIFQDDIIIAISQSGETADTLAAIKIAKERGAFVFGVCNVVGSSISRMTDTGCYTHAGPEIGVASTKAFTTQITVLSLLALHLGMVKGSLSRSEYQKHLAELESIPDKVSEILKQEKLIKEVASSFNETSNCIYLGRGYNFPVALEGALKLKEISYIHAEGYPAAEMKHGPIALIDEQMPVVVIATKKGHYDKVVSNIQEIKSRKGRIIAVVSEGDVRVKELADYCIEVPESLECFTPILTTIPLQLLSYYIAVQRGCNVDQPRNLAKSVT
ncbi:MAG: glutamine--fructose-6-phosphate transaminase (isomerizing), partial [Flavobacteriales bacterium]|nr:glutamine--fructose-6-phosphate transaminase (isomerizing) [Flavobacteriaceae bacterium]MDO7615555.1 glutamine--fructose-6-phosphate transaminase (isomerizing) [Flavobacteriaceae bacterium]MDO7703660.1 glutamine--fructose-6-phosphate transaminase (isomerizing) [Flavobacteriaceae bacterium]